MILGSICGLKNVNQIHQWAKNQRISEFLEVHFLIRKIPCYYWFLCLLKIIDVKSLNQCLMKWAQSFIPETAKKLTLSFDGKTIRSTGKMDKYDSALHIVSAHVAELGITIGQQTVANQENKIPAVRELIGMLKVEGCMVVADALNCQKDTAKAIVKAKADYLLSVKDNQPTLKKDIEDYMQDRELQKAMDICKVQDKRSGRIERRTAYSTCDTAWLFGKEN